LCYAKNEFAKSVKHIGNYNPETSREGFKITTKAGKTAVSHKNNFNHA